MSYTLKLSTEGRPTLTDLREFLALAVNFPGTHEVHFDNKWNGGDYTRPKAVTVELIPADQDSLL